MPSTVLGAGTINEVDVALVLMQHTDWWWQLIKETGKYVITPASTQRCCEEREMEWEQWRDPLHNVGMAHMLEGYEMLILRKGEGGGECYRHVDSMY